MDVAAVCEPAQDAETNESENVVDKMSVVTRGCRPEVVENASQNPREWFTIERAQIANNEGSKTSNGS